MEPTLQLLEELHREEIEQARATPPEEKLLDGPRLFDRACRIMKEGIRAQFPDADEGEVRRILEHRLELIQRLEEER